jgi:hypothetical protein
MNSFAVLIFLLTITAFYAFLSIYLLVHVLTRQTPQSVARKKTLPLEAGRRNANGRAVW